jgi:hypothetical protein
MDGRMRYFFWGRVAYRDAFGESHYVRFKYSFGGSSARKIGSVDICEDGNDAD